MSFAAAYWPDWRHTKIRLYRRLLQERESIVEAERSRWEPANVDPEEAVYHQVTNGLVASAASEFCQYAEDLAILARACASDDYFARELSETKAGRMQETVKQWASIDEQGAAGLLRFPLWAERASWPVTPTTTEYFAALRRAVERLRAVAELYKKWEFHFMRYKHGLLLALTEFADPSVKFKPRRASSLQGQPVAFDCGRVYNPTKLEQPPVLALDMADPDVLLNAAHLAAEGNLLRRVLPHALEPSITEFEQAAHSVSQLQRVLLRNRVNEIEGTIADVYFMPAENPAENQVFRSEASSPIDDQQPTEDDDWDHEPPDDDHDHD